ncbi:MAG: hypothetical protein HOP10_14420 [Chitinophagaceae bacterium]|nr:hypothetical protein [Chitinophagaceae bacterium]
MIKKISDRFISLTTLSLLTLIMVQPVFAGRKKINIPDPPATIRIVLRAPAGTTVTIQNNGAQQLTITTDSNGLKTSSFPAIADGSTYNITIKSAPKGMKFKMERATGTISSFADVRISGDYEYNLISRGTTPSEMGTFFESWDPIIEKEPSDDNSRYIVFVSAAQGLCGATGKFRQIFRKDRLTGKIIMLSRSANGEEGNGNSLNPVISVFKQYVVFESYASNLVGNDENSVRDIFLWSETIEGSNIERVSEGMGVVEANAQSFDASPSGNCGYIAYASSATNLLNDGTEVSGVNIYLWSRHDKQTKLISKDPKTGKGVGGEKPSIDMNGYKIAFWSNAYTLDPDDKNNLWDIFLYEENTNRMSLPLRRITMAHDGSERNQGEESSSRVITPAMSGDGKLIAYATTASNVVPDDNNKMQDVFVYDIDANTTTRASVNDNGEEGNGDSPYGQGERIAITFNGRKVAFTTKASNFGTPAGNVVLYDLDTKKMTPVTTNNGGYVSTPDLSRKGRYVVFGCSFPLDERFNSSGLFTKFINESQ